MKSKILKRLSSILFGIAFLAALRLFGDLGKDFISVRTAQRIFLVSGGIGFLLNLLNYRQTKSSKTFNLLFWLGNCVVLIGLTAMIASIEYGGWLTICGLLIVAYSFLSGFSKKENKNDLIDQ
jgi:hypothetical protein